jgi:cytochrome c5
MHGRREFRLAVLAGLAVLIVLSVVATAAARRGAASAKPKITSVSPTTVKRGGALTIKGTNLTPLKSVRIGLVIQAMKSSTATKVVVTVAKLTKGGKVTVRTAGGIAVSSATVKVSTASTGGSTAPTGGSAAAGKSIFQSNCATCHGADGKGGNGGPDLTSEPLAQTTAGVIKQVTNGGGGMPSFKGQFTSAQLANLAAYVVHTIVGK